MNIEQEEVTINGVSYVKKDSVTGNTMDEKVDDMEYCIVRTYSAGVFAGYVKSRNGQEATILNSRGLWYWDGACGLSQLAIEGTSAPKNCKFTVVVPKRELVQVIEIIPCTLKAKESIENVPVWSK